MRLLDCSASPEQSGQRAVDLSRGEGELRPGTMLGREWNGQMRRVAVLAYPPFRIMHEAPTFSCRQLRHQTAESRHRLAHLETTLDVPTLRGYRVNDGNAQVLFQRFNNVERPPA